MQPRWAVIGGGVLHESEDCQAWEPCARLDSAEARVVLARNGLSRGRIVLVTKRYIRWGNQGRNGRLTWLS